MIVTSYKSHKLSNAMSAIAFHYPAMTNGGDMIADFAKASKKGDEKVFPVLLLCYAAFRKAGDEEARNKTAEELVNEVELFKPEDQAEFLKVMTSLLNESTKKD